MSTYDILTLVAILLLLAFSGFFSGSETALTASSKARIARLAREGNERAGRVEGLKKEKEKLLGGILFGNNLVNILASALATGVLISYFGDEGVFYATLIMTFLVLVFAEVLPKTYAISHPDRMALAVAPIIGFFIWLFSPFIKVIQWIVKMTLKILGADMTNVTHILSGHDELRGAIDVQAEEGRIIKAHRDMLGSILDLDELNVEDVMIHRKNMVMLDVDVPAAELVEKVVAATYTRIPLWQGHQENIVGVLHAKDILRAIRTANQDIKKLNIKKIMSKPWFVPETTTLREQLNAFLRRRAHFALVVDEYGALMGLITLEDILEEIVGDIKDEHDPLGVRAKRLKSGAMIVNGEMTIRDLNRKYDLNLPDSEASTVAGLVLEIAEIIPFVGQKFKFHDLEFEITGRRKNQITKIKITKPKEG